METYLPWLVAFTVLVILVGVVWSSRRQNPAPEQTSSVPAEWSLAPRPVFSTDERRVYRQLREALPHHIVLSKLPLVRFCQPNDPSEVRYWYELLGSIHVTFAICSANGRVLAAIDLDTDRGNSRRVVQIKQSVLGACRVRYLRCPADNLPSVAELQLLVPQAGPSARGPHAVPSGTRRVTDDVDTPAKAPQRRERATLWRDSGFFQDSFFAPDNRLDSSLTGELPAVDTPQPERVRNADIPLDDDGSGDSGFLSPSGQPLSPRYLGSGAQG